MNSRSKKIARDCFQNWYAQTFRIHSLKAAFSAGFDAGMNGMRADVRAAEQAYDDLKPKYDLQRALLAECVTHWQCHANGYPWPAAKSHALAKRISHIIENISKIAQIPESEREESVLGPIDYQGPENGLEAKKSDGPKSDGPLPHFPIGLHVITGKGVRGRLAGPMKDDPDLIWFVSANGNRFLTRKKTLRLDVANILGELE